MEFFVCPCPVTGDIILDGIDQSPPTRMAPAC